MYKLLEKTWIFEYTHCTAMLSKNTPQWNQTVKITFHSPKTLVVMLFVFC